MRTADAEPTVGLSRVGVGGACALDINSTALCVYWSPRLAMGVYYFCRWLCLLLRLSVCLSRAPSKCFFFFVSRWKVSSPCALYKTLFLDFWLRPRPYAQNLIPKICTKTPISRLVWHIDRRCLGLLGGFWGWPIQWNYAKCCAADPYCHGNEIWARRGDLVAYRFEWASENSQNTSRILQPVHPFLQKSHTYFHDFT